MSGWPTGGRAGPGLEEKRAPCRVLGTKGCEWEVPWALRPEPPPLRVGSEIPGMGGAPRSPGFPEMRHPVPSTGSALCRPPLHMANKPQPLPQVYGQCQALTPPSSVVRGARLRGQNPALAPAGGYRWASVPTCKVTPIKVPQDELAEHRETSLQLSHLPTPDTSALLQGWLLRARRLGLVPAQRLRCQSCLRTHDEGAATLQIALLSLLTFLTMTCVVKTHPLRQWKIP